MDQHSDRTTMLCVGSFQRGDIREIVMALGVRCDAENTRLPVKPPLSFEEFQHAMRQNK